MLQAFSVQCTAFLAAKQILTHRTMLGCIISRHRIMTRDQPPLVIPHSLQLCSLFLPW